MQTQKQRDDRMAMERNLVSYLIRTAIEHGYALTKVNDGEEIVQCTTEAEAMEAVFAVDESHIYFKHPEEPKGHCAFIVLGNSGWEAIADSSMGGKWDAVMAECDKHSDKLCEESV